MASKQEVAHNVTVNMPWLGLLGIAFVVLKLVGVIAWPWIWVLAPFWVPLALGILLLITYVVVASLRS